MFITTADLNLICKDTELAQIAGALQTANMSVAERATIAEISGYLNFVYDTKTIFAIKAYDYSVAQAYQMGEVIIDADGKAYNCVATAAAGTALTDTNFFAEGDLRNPLLVMIACDILIYHYHARLPANRVPEHRNERYESALLKLKEIRTNKLNLELPRLSLETATEEQNTDTIKIIRTKPPRNNGFG